MERFRRASDAVAEALRDRDTKHEELLKLAREKEDIGQQLHKTTSEFEQDQDTRQKELRKLRQEREEIEQKLQAKISEVEQVSQELEARSTQENCEEWLEQKPGSAGTAALGTAASERDGG